MTEKALTTYDIAKYCDVSPRTAVQWIKEGKIKAYRTPGKHSRVKKEDFLKFLKEYNIPVPDEMNAATDKKKILIVDDDTAMVNSIRRMLVAEKKYDIEVAYDGFLAGQKFMAQKPDLVILDIRMPKVDGYQLCSAIRGNPGNKDVKILVISGIIDDQGAAKIIKMGANDYLAKPFDNKDLKMRIEKLLGLK